MQQDAQLLAARFAAATAQAAHEPLGQAPADLMTWLAQGHGKLIGHLGTAVDGDGGSLGVLRVPALASLARDAVAAAAPATPGELAIVELADPLGIETAGAPFLLLLRPADSGEVACFALALTVLGQHANVLDIPLVSAKVSGVFAELGLTQASFTGQTVLEFIQTYPRLDLLVESEPTLARTFASLRDLRTSHDLRLFLHEDPLGRFVTALVYLPRDRYNSRARGRLATVLAEQTGLHADRFTARVTESATATIQFTLIPDGGNPLPALGEAEQARLEELLAVTSRTWDEDLAELAGASDADSALLTRYAGGISANYKEDMSARRGLDDLARIDALGPGGVDLNFYESGDGLRFTMYLAGGSVSLSKILPLLQSLGVEVLDERPYSLHRPDGIDCAVYDFGLGIPPSLQLATRAGLAGDEADARVGDLRRLAADGLLAMWEGRAEVDSFNELILSAGLDWRQVALLRAVAMYLRQCGFAYTRGHIAQVLLAHRAAATTLVELFTATFDPDRVTREPGARTADPSAVAAATERIAAQLAAVTSLDSDRVLRAYLHVVQAMVRTNYFRRDADGSPRAVLSFKLEPEQIPEAPKPRPRFEIFVYSPRVEGVHLRFGMVARGGLRWSDRREDFRTEILGLVKAQAVKNAVIVPVGAKGGFVLKRPPAPTGDAAADRDAQRAEGVACYRLFIASLLDVTDNLGADGAVLPPERVVRLDGDDTYLVVAADKGTATFSDIANDVAHGYSFWLGDAFASGGSEGYDHKAMGITARGAWESVKMHFREMGHDTQTEDFTVVGVGDMSGDVFGNGMLLSEHIRLVAAFDHRHVFIDPTPDAAAGFAERARMFALPRSSWADYDTSLISAGGGVFSREQKSVIITPNMRAALGIDETITEMSPPELIHAVLLAPVDLLWNGGIGTYVKASAESDAAVGDRANDAIRVDGDQLRVKVIGEGGNLGVTALGRIEFARGGGRVNTDAMDNSAGVDCSDHEVNIKILVDRQISSGALDPAERHDLLVSMTDDVAALVLDDNVSQNSELSVSRTQAHALAEVHGRMLLWLSTRHGVDLKLEALPTPAELGRRRAAGGGLTSPELCNLMAHVKLVLKGELLAGDLPDSDVLVGRLLSYFPAALRDRAGDAITSHPLRREIVATMVANSVVDDGGLTYAFRLEEETGARAEDAVRAFVAATEIFDLHALWAGIKALGVSSQTENALLVESRRILDRAARWLLANRPQPIAIGAEVSRYSDPVRELIRKMPTFDIELDERDRAGIEAAVADGVPRDLAYRVYSMLNRFSMLDIADIADITDRQFDETGELYFALQRRLHIIEILAAVTELPREGRWGEMARLALRDDVYGAVRRLAVVVLEMTDPEDTTDEKIAEWEARNANRLGRVRGLLTEILDQAIENESSLSVATRALRSLIR
ncbi:NAD-glutamate dehydrogenase [Tsukamurella soli]|uniref:NAD-glutamate dehydrogenase n=1 Tax=Tsukamurella soli TaxID=644556 RepID=UPI00361BC37F